MVGIFQNGVYLNGVVWVCVCMRACVYLPTYFKKQHQNSRAINADHVQIHVQSTGWGSNNNKFYFL